MLLKTRLSESLVPIVLTFLALAVRPSHQGYDQKRLLRDLFEVRKYNVLERPVKNDSDTVSVSVGFSIQQIINLDEKDQFLESSVWIELLWHDAGLIWNPADYGGIYKIRLAPDRVWRPDFLMYNSANDKFDGTWPTNVVVQNDGTISYIPPAMLRSICKVNIRWFPFDAQFCPLKFGSWTYDEAQVNVTERPENPIDLSGYTENGEFNIIRMMVKRDCKSYMYGVLESYPFITLYLHLQRLALYYYFNLIIPAALISVMALLVFTLPVDSGEKMGLSVTILLSLTVFMMVVADFMPRTSEALPLLGIYFSCIMGFCAVALVASVWVLNLHYFPHLNESPPDWIRYGLCVHVAKLLRMTIPSELLEQESFRQAQRKLEKAIPAERRPAHCTSRSLMTNVLDMDDDELLVAAEYELGVLSPNRRQVPRSFSNQIVLPKSNGSGLGVNAGVGIGVGVGGLGGGVPGNGTRRTGRPNSPTLSASSYSLVRQSSKVAELGRTPDNQRPSVVDDGQELAAKSACGFNVCRCRDLLDAALKELRMLGAKVKEDNKTEMVRMEWRFAARVIDRVCLILFSIVNIVCTCVVLFSSPPFGSDETKPEGWP